MTGVAQGGRGRRLLGIVIIVVPWLLRDQIAVGLETASTASQQIQVALGEEEARQQQERDQRATLRRLIALEHKVDNVSAPVEKDATFDSEIDSAGAELKQSVASFTARVKALGIDDDEAAKVHHAGDSATAAAVLMIRDYGKSETTVEQDDALVARFDSAGSAFFKEIQALSAQATLDAGHYSTWATVSRFGAWIMTAIGAVMLGGWKALMRDVAGEGVTKADGEA